MNPKARHALGRLASVVVIALLMMAMITTVAFGGNVHFNNKKGPTFTFGDLTLTASGTIYGLGYGDVWITLDATGIANTLCTNPGGSSKVPGQNPNFSTSGSVTIPAGEVKNGHVSFSVTTEPPESPIPGAPDCPNPGWTETITSITWTNATIIIQQPLGTTVLVWNKIF